jgi:hypothetical protein
LAKRHLGDIAVLEDRIDEAQSCFDKSLALLGHYPCPTIEWRILSSAIDLSKKLKDDQKIDKLLARQKAVIQSLADSVDDEKLRNTFLYSKAIRDLKLF